MISDAGDARSLLLVLLPDELFRGEAESTQLVS